MMLTYLKKDALRNSFPVVDIVKYFLVLITSEILARQVFPYTCGFADEFRTWIRPDFCRCHCCTK